MRNKVLMIMQEEVATANLFLNTPYLGHLGLHPSSFERRHGLLCCSWAVKIHKAIAWREKRIEGEGREEKRQALVWKNEGR